MNLTTLPGPDRSTSKRIERIHDDLLAGVPAVDRVACALYEPADDLLKTFVNSTRAGIAIKGYEFNLAKSESLSRLAREGGYRVIDDIRSVFKPDRKHSAWLLEQGYQSSLTVPVYNHGKFAGIIFFDSRQTGAFDESTRATLLLYADIIGLTIANELTSIRLLTGAVEVSRAFCNMRDFETGAHLERMSRYSRLIAQELAAEYKLSDEYVEHVYLFSPLHDLGKIGIPDRILLKPARLDDAEWSVMRSHPVKGRELLDRVIDDFGLHDLPDVSVMRNIVEYHHECLNGQGYPRGCKGEDIPLEARITTAADIFDALTSRRSYKAPWTLDDAIQEMETMVSSGKLDGRCVQALRRRLPDAIAVRDRYSEVPV